MKRRRIAITGLGLVTPCGRGWKPYWDSVLHASSHIRTISGISLNGFPVRFAGEVIDFEPTEFIKQKKLLKVMSREIKLAVAASCLAIEDANINLSEQDRTRIGISIGTGIINNDLDEVGIGIRNAMDAEGHFHMSKFGQEGIRSLFPLWFLKYLPNMPACHISIVHGFGGPSNTITTSSAAGTQAIGEACRVIERGDADMMLAGGTDSKINAMGISRFYLLGLLSQQQHNPETAYRPFDQKHDGVILGEGAGLIVLEEWDHAKKRGARIYGEIVGYGSSSDLNYDPRSRHDYTGKCLAMQRAFHDASTGPEDIDVVLANGSGVPEEDVQEAYAMQSVFNFSMEHVRVTGVKPITGHLVYGAGGVEVAAATLALQEGIVPQLANLETPDADCDLPFVKGKPERLETKSILINSFGFGGQHAALVLRKGQDA